MKKSRMGNLLLALVLAAGAGTPASKAWAVPPNKVDFAFDVVGFLVGDCGTFQVWTDFFGEGFFIERFDQDGTVTKVNQHINYSQSIYYNSENPAIAIEGGPGEVENDQFDFTGDTPTVAVTGVVFKVTLPGHGVIFHEAGRAVFDFATGEALFQAGPHDFQEQEVAALCAALAG